jgi:NitT/TauT family transport system permease protein
MGYQLHLFFQMFDVAGILAYSVAFVLVVQMVEWGVFRPMDRALQRWRR